MPTQPYRRFLESTWLGSRLIGNNYDAMQETEALNPVEYPPPRHQADEAPQAGLDADDRLASIKPD